MSRIERPSLAVALKYDQQNAPKVVAVGRGELGQRIIDTAREHGVPLEANAPLAEALATIEVETEIPRELYAAVATILAFILRLSATPAPRAAPLKP
jgi:flagellar biosynthesis protein